MPHQFFIYLGISVGSGFTYPIAHVLRHFRQEMQFYVYTVACCIILPTLVESPSKVEC